MKKIKTLELKGGVEVPVKHTSSFLSIGWKDGLRALLIAVGTPVIDYLIETFVKEGEVIIDWQHVWHLGAAAGLMYLAKNYFTRGEVVIDKEQLTK